MSDQMSGMDLGNKILARVQQGMKVYDQHGKEVGKVDDIYLGSENSVIAEEGKGPAVAHGQVDESTSTLPNNVAGAIADADKLPDIVRRRLARHGFLKIDGGILHGDRYASPDQIASVSGDSVRLNTGWDDLLKA